MNQQEYSNILAECLVTMHNGHFPAKRVKEQESLVNLVVDKNNEMAKCLV